MRKKRYAPTTPSAEPAARIYKEDFLDGVLWKFNTNDELLVIISHLAEKIIDNCRGTPSTEIQNLIITRANRISFLAKNMTLKD